MTERIAPADAVPKSIGMIADTNSGLSDRLGSTKDSRPSPNARIIAERMDSGGMLLDRLLAIFYVFTDPRTGQWYEFLVQLSEQESSVEAVVLQVHVYVMLVITGVNQKAGVAT